MHTWYFRALYLLCNMIDVHPIYLEYWFLFTYIHFGCMISTGILQVIYTMYTYIQLYIYKVIHTYIHVYMYTYSCIFFLHIHICAYICINKKFP